MTNMNHQTDSRVLLEEESCPVLLEKCHLLNRGTDDELECWGYQRSAWKKLLFAVLVVLTIGLLLLVVYWKPELECYLKHQSCPLYRANFIMLKSRFGMKSVVVVRLMTEPIEGYVKYSKEENTSEYVGNYTEPSPCTSGSTANLLDNESHLTPSLDHDNGVRYFDFQEVRYLWDQNKHSYRKLEDLSTGTTCFTLHEKFKGLSEQQREARLRLYGRNAMEIHVANYWSLFIEEVMNPFYIFQIASIILWSMDSYYYYAGCIFLISAISIGISLKETRKQRIILRDMVATEQDKMKVCTDTQDFVETPENLLVPGDVIAIPPNGCIMTCDAVLIAGTCIVNESMLTGESVPVTKTQLMQQEDDELYSPVVHKRHTLFSGTHIVQTRYYGHAKVLAVVVRTGFSTAKGELVRAILFPKPLDFQFYRDAIRFILFLSVIALGGMVYSLVIYITNKESVEETVLRVLDIVTIVVPPALPAAMTVGTVYAQNRLKKAKIFCISPPRINFCGRINVFCFDKTGTLTEDGLDMWGVVPVKNYRFTHPVPDPSQLERGPLLVSLATCHSLTIIDGELSGDPLDLIMFNAIKWYLEEPGADANKYDTIMPTVVRPYSRDTFLGEEEEFQCLQHELEADQESGRDYRAFSAQIQDNVQGHPFEVGIIRQFTFSSSSQRMSVITRTMGDAFMELYCKGAPEKVASLCQPETVPQDFHTVLHSYSVQGFRVIALAYRPLDPKISWHQVQRIGRDKVEVNLTFLGLLVMQNQLKPETAPVIRTLNEADIRSVMITGDMLQTAISVARNCGMVGRRDSVILVNAHPPDKENSARVQFEEAEHQDTDSDETATEGDADENVPLMIDGMPGSIESRTSLGKKYTSVYIDDRSHRKHLAVSGRSFSVLTNYFPELIPKICVQGTVFARMSPDQKCQLIEHLQKLDYTVGMCGDGANDCEALKAAHAGISLSEAEASVAAPFTSRVNNIECVVSAMREGRAALVTSFGCFKYMALYSFIQFVSVLILYRILTNLSDLEFLYIDMVITLSIAVLMGNTEAYQCLVRKKPPGSLVKLSNLLSIILQVLLVGGFQLAAYFALCAEGFCIQHHNATITDSSELNAKEVESKTWESTIVFVISTFMYISVAFTFSKGPPFRKPIYTNVLFLLTLVILFALSTIVMFIPMEPVLSLLQMKTITDLSLRFRLIIMALAVGFVVVSTFSEWLVVDSGWLKGFYRMVAHARNAQGAKYKQVHREIQVCDWPPLDQVTLQANGHGTETTEAATEINTSGS